MSLQQILHDQGFPIVVVTLPSLAMYDATNIETYGRQLFDHWGIGSQKNNRGILLLVSLGDRKARITLGSDWGDTKDDTARMVMQDIIVPNFKNGNYSAGVLQGVRALDTMARGQTVRKPVMGSLGARPGLDRARGFSWRVTHSERAARLGLGGTGRARRAGCGATLVCVEDERRQR